MAPESGVSGLIDVINNVRCYHHITRVAVLCRGFAIQAFCKVFRIFHCTISNKTLSVINTSVPLFKEGITGIAQEAFVR